MTRLYYIGENLNTSAEVPLVLLHGFLESSSMWNQLEFPKGYPIIRIDLPGHGKSNQSSLNCDSIENMVKAVLEVLDELKLDRFHVVGHSMGGYLGLEMKKNDSRTEKLVLMNSNFWSDSKQKVRDRKRVAEIVQTNQSHFIYEVIPNLFLNPQVFDREVKSLIKEAMKMSPDAIAKTSIAMSKREDFTDFVHAHGREIICIQGVEDRIVELAQMRKATRRSEIKLIELEDVGHVAHFEAPSKVNEIVADFLKA